MAKVTVKGIKFNMIKIYVRLEARLSANSIFVHSEISF